MVFGFGAFETGLVFFFVGSINVLTQAALLPMLSKRFSRLNLTMLGITFFATSLLVLSLVSNLPVLLAVFAAFSFGFGVQYATVNTLISLSSPENAQGAALGVAWAIAGAAQTVTHFGCERI